MCVLACYWIRIKVYILNKALTLEHVLPCICFQLEYTDPCVCLLAYHWNTLIAVCEYLLVVSID